MGGAPPKSGRADHPDAKVQPELRLGSSKGTVPLAWDRRDPVSRALADRLAVLLLDRGFRRGSSAKLNTPEDGARLLRFRPKSRDPAFALLELILEAPDLAKAAGDLLSSQEFFASHRRRRQLAAVELEERLREEAWAIPLLSRERSVIEGPRITNVRVDPRGVPLLDQAYLETSR
ncbi:MAG: hypothetical protein VX498_13020 [Myxococcota bacterium]|nr:hypothetical protein [Myxococcota bacterium]